jgi:Spy/CpxP family protein refolding chaperone
MKLITTLFASLFALSVYAAEPAPATAPAAPAKAADGMLLAKKKDHTNDNKSAPAKKTETQKAPAKKEEAKPATK